MTENKNFSSSFDSEKAIQKMNEFKRWEKDPLLYEKYDGKENHRLLTNNEYKQVKGVLLERFRDQVLNSSLYTGRGIGQKDLDLIHEIQDFLKEIENKIVPDDKRRPWNEGCIEHSRQVEIVSRVMAQEINQKNPDIKLDLDKISAKAALHDIGRFASQEKEIHGLAGRQLLKELGFAPTFRTTALAHLEAGVGPYITDINQESWEDIQKDKGSLKKRIVQYPLKEVIISLADMSKKGELIDGKFYNNIADPIEGLWPSIKRRMPEGVTDDEIRATMYVGFAQILKDHIENKFSVSFSGPEGMIEKAKKLYQQTFGQ